MKDLPLVFQETPPTHIHGNYIFAPCIDEAKSDLSVSDVVQKLKEKEIGARPIYNTPVYKQPAYKTINEEWRWAKAGIKYPNYSELNLKVTEKISRNHFEIPVHPGVTIGDLEYISESLHEIFG